jgi:hypothetical protein
LFAAQHQIIAHGLSNHLDLAGDEESKCANAEVRHQDLNFLSEPLAHLQFEQHWIKHSDKETAHSLFSKSWMATEEHNCTDKRLKLVILFGSLLILSQALKPRLYEWLISKEQGGRGHEFEALLEIGDLVTGQVTEHILTDGVRSLVRGEHLLEHESEAFADLSLIRKKQLSSLARVRQEHCKLLQALFAQRVV